MDPWFDSRGKSFLCSKSEFMMQSTLLLCLLFIQVTSDTRTQKLLPKLFAMWCFSFLYWFPISFHILHKCFVLFFNVLYLKTHTIPSLVCLLSDLRWIEVTTAFACLGQTQTFFKKMTLKKAQFENYWFIQSIRILNIPNPCSMSCRATTDMWYLYWLDNAIIQDESEVNDAWF